MNTCPQPYLETYQTSKMEFFAKTVKGRNPLTIFVQNSVLDVWQCYEYAFAAHLYFFIRYNTTNMNLYIAIYLHGKF